LAVNTILMIICLVNMQEDKKHYRFVNGQTGYVIAYFSVSIETSPEELNKLLDKKKKQLAIEHEIYFETIYWETDKHK
jgi:hypothetical protein